MCSLFFRRLCGVSSALIAHWCLVTSQLRASVALQEKVFQLYLLAAADRVSLEGARQTSTNNHWKLFLCSNMFIHKPTGSYFTCPLPLPTHPHAIWSCGILDQTARLLGGVGTGSAVQVLSERDYVGVKIRFGGRKEGRHLDISQRVLMSSLFPAPISAATTCWEVIRTFVEIFRTLGKCGAGPGSERGGICGWEPFQHCNGFDLIWGEWGMRCRNMIE